MNNSLFLKINEICQYMTKKYTLESAMAQCNQSISRKQKQNSDIQYSSISKPDKPFIYHNTEKYSVSGTVGIIGITFISVLLMVLPYIIYSLEIFQPDFTLGNIFLDLLFLLLPTASKVLLPLLWYCKSDDIIKYVYKSKLLLFLYPIILIIQLLRNLIRIATDIIL